MSRPAGGAPWSLLPYVFYAGGRAHSEIGAVVGYASSIGAGLRGNWKAFSFSLEYGRGEFRGGNGFGETKLFAKGQVAF